MKKIFKKTISIFLLMAIVVSNLPLGTIVAGVRPSVSVSAPSKTSVEEGSSVTYRVTFSNADRINNLEDYVTLNGFDAKIGTSESGDNVTITLSNVQGTSGKKSITIQSGAAENDNGKSLATPKSQSFTLVEKTVVNDNTNNNTNNSTVETNTDTIRPSASISNPSVNSINVGGTVKYTISFADNKGIANINLSRDYITLNGFEADISTSKNGNNVTITLSNVQGTAGKKNISVKAGAASDAAGNVNLATPNSYSFTLVQKTITNDSTNNNTNNNTTNGNSGSSGDTVRPSISISAPSMNSINMGGTVTYIVSFADNKGIEKINITKDYINLNGFTANIEIVKNGDSATISLSNVQGSVGQKNISIKAGAATDIAGNKTLATPKSISFTLNADVLKVEPDEVRPSVSISEPSVKEINAGGTVSYVISFADNRGVTKVNLVDASYLTFNGFTANVKVTGSGNIRTVTLSNIQGKVGVNYNIIVNKGAAEDAAGNLSVQTPHSISFKIIEEQVDSPETPVTPDNKLDNEPNTGVESLPVLPIMGAASAVLSVAGYVITKKIYG